MKLSKELVLQAVTAAFEFNDKNDHANAHVIYDSYSLTLGLNVYELEGWAYYKISSHYRVTGDIYAESHEQNLADFLNALKSRTSHF